MKTSRLMILTWFLLVTDAWAGIQEEPPPPRSDRPPMRRMDGPDRARRMSPPDRRGPKPPTWKDMPEAERKDVLRFMEEHFPRMVVELDRVKEDAPQRYDRRMERIAPEMHRLMHVRERDPARAMVLIRERQVSLRLQDLARDYRAAEDSDEKAKIRKNIRELAAEEFDNRVERRDLEVRELENRLAELKSRLEEMKSVRDEMLDRRTKELIEKENARAKAERKEDRKDAGDSDEDEDENE
jgi:hypothetical protein